MSQHFTHLHLHTDFSLLDGAITLDKLIQFGKEQQLKALAITDHGNIFGAVKFFQKCKKAGIKPILGIEAYITSDARIKNAQDKYHHIVLLVQNQEGYRNLCKLISFSYQEGFYFKPRIDDELIAAADCHYLTPDDREAHEIMLAIQTHDTLDNPNRYTFGDCRVHVRSQEEMYTLFADHESALWNTGKIASLCDFSFTTGK